jgi:hypothetical protein
VRRSKPLGEVALTSWKLRFYTPGRLGGESQVAILIDELKKTPVLSASRQEDNRHA